ncbi:MAG: efflux RND transporter periplasmic adaptor subunit, partial [Verrucomicrobiota bacterium]
CGYRDGLGEVSVFRTRDGLVGFYQLRGLADADGRGVNIRYKLVQGGATNAAAAKPKMRAPQAVTATGSLIDGSQVAAKAGTTSKWVCWAAVAEADITAVSVGQDVIMTLEAFPQRTFQGKVAYIGNMPDTTQNQVTYETLIDLADPDPKFKAGMSANIMFSVAQHEGATNAAAGDKPAPVFHGASFVLPLRQAPAPAEAAPVPVPVVVRNIPALLPIGGILLLLVGGIAAIVLAVRKSKLGAGRTMAIGCGVIMLGFVLVLLLVAVSFMGKTFQAAATRWSVQHARLQSARSTPSVAPGLAFGPVVEREIPSGKSCLRLATGDLIPMSAPALSGDDVRKLRGDVYQPMIENDANALTILDVNVLELDAAAWDSLSASDLENQFPLKASTERASQRRSETRIPPGVYGFKTYDKAGILQVLGMNGSGVKIRYKLVQNTITPAASVSMPPAAPPPVRDSRLQFRLVAEANDSTAELLPDHRGKQQFRVRREILLDDAAVAEAKVNGEGSNTAIDLIFTEAGGKRFAAITSANRGKQLAVIFDGKVLFAPLIHDAVTAGFAQINGNFTLDEAKLIARVLMAKAVPRFTALIACFNGKVDSGSSCSGNNFQPDGTIHPKGKMTCGYPGKVSEVEWAFVEQRGGKDVYRFTRRFPADTAKAATTSKDIEFSDRRVVVFADAFQAVVIEPAKNTNAVSSTPKL